MSVRSSVSITSSAHTEHLLQDHVEDAYTGPRDVDNGISLHVSSSPRIAHGVGNMEQADPNPSLQTFTKQRLGKSLTAPDLTLSDNKDGSCSSSDITEPYAAGRRRKTTGSEKMVGMVTGLLCLGKQMFTLRDETSVDRLAFLCGVSHYILFSRLNGSAADGNFVIPQSYVTTTSLILTALFRATLLGSVGICFAQILWRLQGIALSRFLVLRASCR
jgi:hypothetical protein